MLAPEIRARQEPRLLRGDDAVIAPPKPQPVAQGAAHTFKFEEAPISEVVHVMLRDILRVSYVLHQPVAGSVTLATRGPVSADDALAMLESALLANGLVMVRDTRGTYHVGKADVLRGIGSPVRQPSGKGPLPAGYGAIVVPLQFIGASEMAAILKPLMPAEALARVDNTRNLLVLIGTRVQAEGWLDMVNTFDVNLLKGMSVGVFPLKHVTVAEVESALQLLGSASVAATGAATPQPAAPARAGSAGAQAASGAASGLAQALNSDGFPLRGAIRVMPIARINSILVVTPRAAYLDEARRWIEKLDQPTDNGAEPGLHIYKVQNGNAQHLASVLSGIFGGTASPTAQQDNTGVAPGLRSATVSTPSWQQQGANGMWGSGQTGMAFGSGTGGFGAGTFGTQNRFGAPLATNAPAAQANASAPVVAQVGGVRVMADTLNNSILVWSTTGEFQKIESTLKRLDLPPTQVLIEATIIEVTLGDDLKYGLQWAFSDTHRHGAGSGLVGQVPGASGGGFSYTLTDSLGKLRLTLNALADKSLIKVISSPSLMVLDNQVATMAVGTQQPIRTGETNYLNGTNVNQGTPITTNYQYKDTGVQLQVQPSVNSGDLVTMDINQSVTDVGDQDTITGQRTFLQRQIASKVAVRSGQAIVLGGLIKDNASTGKSGVPFLQDIPVLGHLFGATTTNNARTELLVIITPKVVRTDPEIREISEELRDRLKGLHLLDLRDSATGLRAPVTPLQTRTTP
ncbi:type II secretion system protein GspD [Comamonas flocculans]|uniref:Type II secretion system protein GspD n=2 Tax=Comamonas flocculans TaxID=2597701 RepID=A0A5B8RY56_9BURK|nr:type II secretion system protein GspD [Comamonas flocculans]